MGRQAATLTGDCASSSARLWANRATCVDEHASRSRQRRPCTRRGRRRIPLLRGARSALPSRKAKPCACAA